MISCKNENVELRFIFLLARKKVVLLTIKLLPTRKKMARVRVEHWTSFLQNDVECVRHPIEQATDLCVSSYNLKYSIQYTMLL